MMYTADPIRSPSLGLWTLLARDPPRPRMDRRTSEEGLCARRSPFDPPSPVVLLGQREIRRIVAAVTQLLLVLPDRPRESHPGPPAAPSLARLPASPPPRTRSRSPASP